MELIAQFGLFNGLLALLLILVYSFRKNRNKIFLGLSLFFVWYCLLNLWLNVTGLILQYPALQRTGLIAAYMAFPFLFIYSRNAFYPGQLWKKIDWILLLPAVLYIIDFMPFFLLPGEQKIAIWRENLANNSKMFLASEGWMGLSGFHFSFIYVWIALIMYFQFRLIIRNWNLKSGFHSPHNRRLLYFIVTITILYLPLFMPGIFGVLLKASWFNPTFIGFTYGLSLSTVSIYLLIFPNILYGFLPEMKFSFPKSEGILSPDPLTSNGAEPTLQPEQQLISTNENLTKAPATNQEITPELAIVLQQMKEKKPFLKQGLTIQDLSNETGIPVYQLSPLINGYFKMNFVNWINRYRIEYFIKQAIDNEQMTLEALSKEAGFISRSTFITAFKKEKGVTPREYLKVLKLSA